MGGLLLGVRKRRAQLGEMKKILGQITGTGGNFMGKVENSCNGNSMKSTITLTMTPSNGIREA